MCSHPCTMSTKVFSIVIKARLDCPRCHDKIKKAICSLCVCEINSKSFDEKSNTITLIGIFDPKKVVKKICKKAGKCIDSLDVSEVVNKKPETGAANSSGNKNTADGTGEKTKAQGNVGGDKGTDKGTDKGSKGQKEKEQVEGNQQQKSTTDGGAKGTTKGTKEKTDQLSLELSDGQALKVVVQTPPPPTAAPPPPPEREVIVCPPAAVIGAPVGWSQCHCGPCSCGCYCQPCRPEYETRPDSCGCSSRTRPCSIGRDGCSSGNCVVLRDEESCKTM